MVKRAGPIRTIDSNLYVAINRLPHQQWLTKFMAGLSTAASHGSGWALLALVLAFRDGRRGRAAASETIPTALVTNALVEQVIKVYFRRRRPFITQIKALVVGHRSTSWSFPSGHSAISFACASALSRSYKGRRSLFYCLASLIGFSRIYLGHHYPSDVVTGAAVGEGMSRGIGVIIGKLLSRR